MWRDCGTFYKKNIKSEVDKSDIDNLAKLDADELKPVPTDLNDKLKNDVVKKDAYDTKIKNI